MIDQHEINTLADLRRLMPLTDKQRDKLDSRVYDHIDAHSAAFISNSPLLFMASGTGAGHVDLTAKGDMPGFVEVQDKHTLIFPERVGNNDARVIRNLLQNKNVAVLFVVPTVGEFLRITGTATLTADPELCKRFMSCGKPAVMCLKIIVQECFFNCKRTFNRSHIWHPEKWLADHASYMANQTVSRLNRQKDRSSEEYSVEKYNAITDKIIADMGEKDGAY